MAVTETTPDTDTTAAKVSNKRVWLFRVLVVAAAGLMLLSWVLPWWRADITVINAWVQIHPWGIDCCTFVEEYFPTAAMPGWFAPFAWTYLGICIALLLFSLFAKEKVFSLGKFKFSLPQLIIGGVGLSYMVALVIMVVYGSIRATEYSGMKFLGNQVIEVDPEMNIVSGAYARLLFGYWLAWAVGLLLVVLALVRNRIIGKPELTT
jgi:hypothetical protein